MKKTKLYEAPRLDFYEVGTEDVLTASSPFGYMDGDDTDEYGNLKREDGVL